MMEWKQDGSERDKALTCSLSTNGLRGKIRTTLAPPIRVLMHPQDMPGSEVPSLNTVFASPPPNNPLHLLQCFLSSLHPVSDQDSSSIHHENSLEGALNILDNEPSLITKVVSATSQRALYLVQGSGSTSKNKTDNEIYLCFISNDYTDAHSMHHCSCRSFWERSRSNGSATLCKHLLALQLLPSLGIKCHTIEVLSDEEFANIVMTRLRINY
jgi:hypothetical protein